MRLSTEARNRVLGLVFIVLAVVAVGLLIAKFKQKFDTTPTVTLFVPTAGSQLNADADVKVRGIIIGRVKAQHVVGNTVKLQLAIPRSDLNQIPKDVRARLLPKTLFGEKYVDLIIPPASTGGHLVPGDVITIDRSTEALELERVLADFTYVLRELQPVKVNTFLTNLSGALANNGTKLGKALTQFDAYTKAIEPNITTIQTDLRGIADLADSLDVNAKDLLQIARNSATTGSTINAKQDDLARFLTGTAGFAESGTRVFTADGDRIIAIAANSHPTLETLAALRGNLPAGVKNLNQVLFDLVDPTKGALRQGPFLNVRLYPQTSQGHYTNADCPRYPGANGPNCPPGTPVLPAAKPASATTAVPARLPAAFDAVSDKESLHNLLAPMLGVAPDKVPGIADLLLGGILRGSLVSLQ